MGFGLQDYLCFGLILKQEVKIWFLAKFHLLYGSSKQITRKLNQIEQCLNLTREQQNYKNNDFVHNNVFMSNNVLNKIISHMSIIL